MNIAPRRTALKRIGAAAVAALALVGQPAAAQTDTAFTYQGRLDYQGSPYSGTADYRFSLWDAPVSGQQVSANFNASQIRIEDGLLTAPIDFGSDVWAAPRWLEIAVRTPAWDGQGQEPAFTTLAGRQPISRSPYSMQTRGIFVNADGTKVGVGTAAPLSPLHVVGQDNDGVNAGLRIQSNSQTMLIDGNEIDSDASVGLYLNNNSETPVIIGNSGGDLGVGTSSPDHKLHVLGDTFLEGDVLLGAFAGDTIDMVGQVRFPDGSVQTSYHVVATRRDMSVNFGELDAFQRGSVTATLFGAQPGDVLVLSVNGDVPEPFILHGAYVSAPDTFRFHVTNVSLASRNPPAISFNIVALRP